MSPQNLVNNSYWLKGTPFLWEQTITYKGEEETAFALSPDDPEEDPGLSHKWKAKRRNGFDPETSGVLFRLESCKEGDTNLLKIEAPYLINFKWEVIKTSKVEKSSLTVPAITVDELRHAKIVILRLLQSKAF